MWLSFHQSSQQLSSLVSPYLRAYREIVEGKQKREEEEEEEEEALPQGP
jgi:hypothetical protein